MRRFRIRRLGSRITVAVVGVCLGTIAVIYVYAVAIGGAAAGAPSSRSRS